MSYERSLWTCFRHVISLKLLVISTQASNWLQSGRSNLLASVWCFRIFTPIYSNWYALYKKPQVQRTGIGGIANWHLLNSSPYAAAKTKNLWSCSSKVVLPATLELNKNLKSGLNSYTSLWNTFNRTGMTFKRTYLWKLNQIQNEVAQEKLIENITALQTERPEFISLKREPVARQKLYLHNSKIGKVNDFSFDNQVNCLSEDVREKGWR